MKSRVTNYPHNVTPIKSNKIKKEKKKGCMLPKGTKVVL
jgi:hypothetical protein